MYKGLIVDSERDGREQIRHLLEQQPVPFEMELASGVNEALDILEKETCDLMLIDASVAESLVGRVAKRFPSLFIVIFCPYEDYPRLDAKFSHGRVHCCLKRSPQEAFTVLLRELYRCAPSEEKELPKRDVQCRHLLQKYLYTGKLGDEAYVEMWGQYRRAILIESDQPFFDTSKEELAQKLGAELHRQFYCLNLNSWQALLLFRESYCDYALIGKHIYVYLKRKSTARFYIAVSRQIQGVYDMPEAFASLEQELEERFYHTETHVYTSEEDEEKFVTEETQDSQLMQRISEDVSRKDVSLLKKHFGVLVDKYQKRTQFSAMYVKFVFSSVLQELFQEPQFAHERQLEKQIDLLYSYSDMDRILEVTRQAISEYEIFLNGAMKASESEVRAVQAYVAAHPEEDLSLEKISERVKLSPGYLDFLFHRMVGVSYRRYIHQCRLDLAKRLLQEGKAPFMVSSWVGFLNQSYFLRCYEEYFGVSPQGEPS